MDKLPEKDAAMLASAINFLLRDGLFDSLDDVCGHYGLERSDVERKLAEAGLEYSEELRKVW